MTWNAQIEKIVAEKQAEKREIALQDLEVVE